MSGLADRLDAERKDLWNEAERMLDQADTAKRNLTKAEQEKFKELNSTMDELRARADSYREDERNAAEASRALAAFTGASNTPDGGNDPSAAWINTDTGERAAVRAGESIRTHRVFATASTGGALAEAQYSGVGEMIRAMTTTGGSAVVPISWAASLIDLAREKSAVMSAGAQIVPMASKVVNIGRLTGAPTTTFRTEGSSITPSDVTLDNVTLTATTQSALVIGSLEWFQDADNAQVIVTNAIAQAIAEHIDRVALYGGITSGAGSINLPTPPNPRGILAALNATKPANVLGGATNGTVQTPATFWGEVIDLLFTVRDSNEVPNALIWSSKAGRQYAKAVATDGQPLQLPPDVAAIQRLTSNKIPSYTQGTMTNRATDLFAGSFDQLIVGQRLGLTIQVLTERYAEFGQVGIVAHWRGDVQPARPGAFAVYRAIQGAL